MNKWIRFLAPLAIIAVAAFVLRDRMPFLAEGYQQVRQANATGLVLAFLAVFISIFAMSEVMRILLRAGGSEVSARQTANLVLVANAWSASLPGGPAVSTMYQFHTMRKWGVSTLVISWFVVLSGAIATMWLVAMGVVAVLFFGADFSIWPLLGTGVVMAAASLALYVLTNNPRLLLRVTHLLPRWKVKIDSAILQMDAVRLTPTTFIHASLYSLANWILDVIGLWLCVWAVTDVLPTWSRIGETPSFFGITLAFVTAKIVGTAQVTPAGVGPVEAAMTAGLVAAGMPASSAFGAVLVYRVISFALITLIGWAVYGLNHLIRGEERPSLEMGSPNDAAHAGGGTGACSGGAGDSGGAGFGGRDRDGAGGSSGETRPKG